MLPVVEVRSQPAADAHAQIWGDAHVSAIEQCMNVRAQQEAVVDPVSAAFAHRTDVGSLQDG